MLLASFAPRSGLRPSTLSRSVSHTISNHPFLSPKQPTPEEEHLSSYLQKYLTLAFENAPPAASSVSHYRMLASVVIEFCVVTQRLDVLYNDIFSKFVDKRQAHTFVDLLEPFVVTDQLKYISPVVMSEFVDYCKLAGDLRR